jgi:septal ring factor EnvC (AmiA/AmiB activator)
MPDIKEPGEVMMPMSQPDALQHIEITVLRQLGENIAAQTRHLEELSKDVRDLGKDVREVRENVIRIEAQQTHKQVETLNARVSILEARGNQVQGVTAFGSWIVQAAPWLITAFVIVAAFLGIGKK